MSMSVILAFNPAAIAVLGTNTRLRVKKVTRGGVDYLALRPSYRVAGRNTMVRTDKTDDGLIAVIPEQLFTDNPTFPTPKTGGTYHFHDVGYGWFLLQEKTDLSADEPSITVSRRALPAENADPAPQAPEAAKTDEPPKTTKPARGKASAKPKATPSETNKAAATS